MSYRFNGFFARPSVARPAILPENAVWRDISAPFIGIGVKICVTGLGYVEPGRDEARKLLAAVGLGSVSDWLYIDYVTWAGRIDNVYGLGVYGGREFGPICEDEEDKTREAYLLLMSQFGVSSTDAIQFRRLFVGSGESKWPETVFSNDALPS